MESTDNSEFLDLLLTYFADGVEVALYSNPPHTRAYVALLKGENIGPAKAEEVFDFFVSHRNLTLSPEAKVSALTVLAGLSANESSKPFEIFHAKEAVPSKDGELEWILPQKPSGKASADGEGRVNFYEVENVVNVLQGQELCRVLHPEKGREGRDIFGRVISVSPAREAYYRLGEGVEFRAEDRVMIASRDGGLTYSNGVISVDPVYSVKGDVDFSIGNISFRGSVNIAGGVQDGFQVKTFRDLHIGGVCGACVLKAGGSLYLKGGIAGKSRAQAEAAGKIQAKYINAASIRSSGDVEVFGGVLNSTVFSGGNLLISNGNIVGGEITALGSVSADILGSEMGVRTLVCAGEDGGLKGEVLELNAKVKDLHNLRDRIEEKVGPMLRQPEKIEAMPEKQRDVFRKLSEETMLIHREIETHRIRQDDLKNRLSKNITRTITARKKVYAGTIIEIAQCRRVMDEDIVGPVQFYVDPESMTLQYRKRSHRASGR